LNALRVKSLGPALPNAVIIAPALAQKSISTSGALNCHGARNEWRDLAVAEQIEG
jgi:hypothetical protein